ncbi:aminodeoxychorismate synthase component I [Pseudomonadales bacterium]|nr:aminodeoxychorismate synthase component I [Pseudomonadales bacterium]MDB4068687.1 aminodeoxychorismate synthase component I [Pseudomonadales bacterium]MDB9879919.1 aminodeoxychorismate synthase component I [Pseudomonadales bacterium]
MPWSIEKLPYETDAFAWFRRLEEQHLPFLLESHGAEQQRYDIIGANPSKTIEVNQGHVRVDQVLTTLDAFDAIEQTVRAMAPDSPCPLNLPFQGGAVGFFGYELTHRAQKLPELADAEIDLADMLVGIYDIFIVIDHELHESHLVCTPEAPANTKALWAKLLAPARKLAELDFQSTSAVQMSMSASQYYAAFEKIKTYIEAGDCYQVNFAQRFSATYQGNPLGLYQALRQTQRAPFSACIRTPAADILSFSPERLVRVADRQILTQPIKGTRPRHPHPSEDLRLAEELQSSEKDRAENLMIVDLLRNDLGKTAVPGSIAVDSLFELVSFANVHHLVSSVSGKLRPGVSAMDLLRACFPGGSVTGAPKHRAMQIIAELEPVKRQVYCGAIGYYSYHGNLDTNLPIRTIICSNSRLHYWGGGGIVADSEAAQEYEETLTKVNFISHALASLTHKTKALARN